MLKNTQPPKLIRYNLYEQQKVSPAPHIASVITSRETIAESETRPDFLSSVLQTIQDILRHGETRDTTHNETKGHE
jgi:hypothetical protein